MLCKRLIWQVLSDSQPEHILRFYGACLWDGNLVLITELMQVRVSCADLWLVCVARCVRCRLLLTSSLLITQACVCLPRVCCKGGALATRFQTLMVQVTPLTGRRPARRAA